MKLEIKKYSLVILYLTILVIISLRSAILTPINHIDGSFQSVSGELHLNDGSFPGLNFLPYIGVGPVLMMFPIFKILGANLAASVLSSHLTVVLSFSLVTWTIYRLTHVTISKINSFICACTFFVVLGSATLPVFHKFPFGILLNVSSQTLPENSVRALRAFLPYLTVFIILKWKEKLYKETIYIGLIIGFLSALWSPDYGIVSAAFGVASVLGILLMRKILNFKLFLKLLAGFIIGYFVLSSFILGGYNGFYSLFKYNFTSVRGDQYWYFAPYSHGHIFGLLEFLNDLKSEGAIFGVFLLFFLVFYAIKRRNENLLLLAVLGIILLAGGTVSTLLGHRYVYMQPFVSWSVLSTLFLAPRLFVYLLSFVRNKNRRTILMILKRTKLERAGFIMAVFFLISILVGETNSYFLSLNKIKANTSFEYNSKLGGYIDKDYRGLIQSNLKPDAIEEYFGLSGVINGHFSGLPVDAVIHALGNQRDLFSRRMQNLPSEVITTNPNFNFYWSSWSVSTNWWFYKYLFLYYTPRISSPSTVTWTRNEYQKSTANSVPCKVLPDGAGVNFEGSSDTLYQLNLKYKGPGENRSKFSMLRNNLNFEGDGYRGIGYVALNPGSDYQEIPVLVAQSGSNKLDLINVERNPALSITKILSCSITVVVNSINAKSNLELKTFLDLLNPTTPFNLTDENWAYGVARRWAGFFVMVTPKSEKQFINGKKIEFNNGEIRTIISTTSYDGYLNIYLDGGILNPSTVGYPKPFKILKAN